MTTQVIFKIDKKLKDRAMKKAEAQGVPFSVVLKFATQAYVDGDLDMELRPQPQLNEKTRRILKRELQEIRQGKNLSPVFDNAKDAIAYLKNL
jgi:antitoxin component of RelBE/YafQ-DinJ toxin-antitoxin module